MGDIKAVLEACGVGPQNPAILLGHSMGAMDGMLFYLKNEAYVKGFVLYATGPGFAKEKPWQKWNEDAVKQANGYKEKGLDALLGSDKTKGHRSAKGLELSCRGCLAQHASDPLYKTLADGPLHLASHLDEIKVPSRIICGERDKVFKGACEMLNSKLPDAKLTMLPNAGHMCCEKNGDEFNKVLLGYLDELASK